MSDRLETAKTTRLSERPVGYWRGALGRLRRNRGGMAGLYFVLFMIVVWILSPMLATDQPIVCRYQGRWYFPAVVEVFQSREGDEHWIEKSRPFNLPQFKARDELAGGGFALWPVICYNEYEQSAEFLAEPSGRHLLGTDELGRDIAARLVHGTGVSVKVGFVSMAIASIIGIAAGAAAGYYGGWVDMVISRIIEVVICFPVFMLILAIMVWLEPGITKVMIVIGVTRWTSIARYTRGEFIKNKQHDYVIAARSQGVGGRRIMIRHILPNSLTPVLVNVSFGIAGAILMEAGLSWLGFGVQPPSPSWGNILRSAYDWLQISPHMVYPPCVAIFLAVCAFNLLGEGLRDAIDPRLRNI